MLAIDRDASRQENESRTLVSNVLVPVDFSKRCAVAAGFAVSLAHRLHAKATLLHIEKPFEDDFYWTIETARWAKEQMANFLPESAREPDVHRIVRMHSNVANGILRYSYEYDIDLIVMPTRGYGAIRRAILGSVASGVLRDAPCPVWTSAHADLEPAMKRLRTGRILCAVNSVKEGSKALSWASKLASELNAKLQVAWSQQALRETREEIDRLERAYRISAETVTDAGNVPDALRRAAVRMQSDLLVVGRSFGRSPVQPGLDMYQVVRQAPCPVVSV